MMRRVNDRLFSWASDIEQDTIRQAEKTARLPIVEDHVALMPDAHVGMGATVGSVIPTKDAIIPAAVGVDIGCGMIATELAMTADDLPDDLDQFFGIAAQVVPAGTGQGHAEATRRSDTWFATHGMAPGAAEVAKSGLEKKARVQFGSLGSGNHFFEVCLDESDNVWLVLHSGSRGVGNQLAQVHIKKAKRLAKDLQLGLEDADLAYFTQAQPEFEAYLADMLWAQAYALGNRQAMMDDVLDAFVRFVANSHGVARPPIKDLIRTSLNTHHNFTAREVHQGKTLWITRKGAIKAATGDLGVIPGSMGTRSYIVRGLGNPDSWNSCSHGAGRRMSRSAAKRAFTADDLRKHMAGKVWNDEHADQLVDEHPDSYKDVDQVMDDQQDLVEVLATLHQIFNLKGTK